MINRLRAAMGVCVYINTQGFVCVIIFVTFMIHIWPRPVINLIFFDKYLSADSV